MYAVRALGLLGRRRDFAAQLAAATGSAAAADALCGRVEAGLRWVIALRDHAVKVPPRTPWRYGKCGKRKGPHPVAVRREGDGGVESGRDRLPSPCGGREMGA